MKQTTLFNLSDSKQSKYTKSVGSLVYEPKNKKPRF